MHSHKMKTFSLLATLMVAPGAQAEIIAFWDFNERFDVGNGAAQVVQTASIGDGILYQQRANIDGNGKGGVTFTDTANGIDTTGATDERSIAWDDFRVSGDNDAEFFITIDTTNFEDITVSFDIQGDDAPLPPPSFDLKFDTAELVDVMNPGDVVGTIKDFENGTSIEIFNNEPLAATPAFTRVSFDLSAVDGIEGQSILALRFDDFDNADDANGQLRFDNLLITGTAVPEPSSAVLALVGLGILARRRRS